MDTLNLLERIETIADITNAVRPRIYKRRIDGFAISDDDFRKKYRFKKETVNKILNLIKNDIEVDRRGCGTSAEIQILVALRCWGRREFQDDAGDLQGLSQATVSRICVKVARALAKHAKEKIKMPSSAEQEATLAKKFRQIRNFPGIIGAIDCTHIKIKKTGGDMAQYYINRKGFYSLNVQVICDAELKVLDIVARWRGSTHDCRIFNESSIKERFEKKEFKGRLLGDSGYKLTPYLFTPLLRPQNEKEFRYNTAHIATRNTVERCFGVWKQRFRCLLDGITVSFSNAKVLIVALAVLHNIAREENDNVPANLECDEPIQNYVAENVPLPAGNSTRRENALLKTFIEKYF